ncbi:hypothetical protein X946_5189 [Burkholderia sp. ABCPW 111]|nr:hypothetical protein X946_5189 [Burkholderia sp. ABCPW 111]
MSIQSTSSSLVASGPVAIANLNGRCRYVRGLGARRRAAIRSTICACGDSEGVIRAAARADDYRRHWL